MNRRPPNHHIPTALALTDSILMEAALLFGTPLYVYDDLMIESRYSLLLSILPKNASIFYSVKANPNPFIVKKYLELGASLEIASEGELSISFIAGTEGKHVIFVGPGKKSNELKRALESRLSFIVAESSREIDRIQSLSALKDQQTMVAFRVNPGRGRGMITMGGSTQFGMTPESIAQCAMRKDDYPNLTFAGLHAYAGTGILKLEDILRNTEMILDIFVEIQRKTGMKFSFCDVGGGFGIPYFERDVDPEWNMLKEPLSRLVTMYLCRYPYTEVFGFESGRFLIGPAGVFIARVIDIKRNGGKTFVVLDGGTNVFNVDAQYRGHRAFPMRVLTSRKGEEEPVTLCGPLCTTADQMAVDILLPRIYPDDLIAIYQAGAYGLTASPGLFLSHGFPGEVMLRNGSLQRIRQPLTPADLLLTHLAP